MRIDWETVGSCVDRTLNDIEPERSRRLDDLVNIGIDETSYKKGHKYEAVQLAKEHPRKKGRPKADDTGSALVKAAKARAEEIKNSAYALGSVLLLFTVDPDHLPDSSCLHVRSR